MTTPGLGTTGPHIIPLGIETHTSSATEALIKQTYDNPPTKTARHILMSSGDHDAPHAKSGQRRTRAADLDAECQELAVFLPESIRVLPF